MIQIVRFYHLNYLHPALVCKGIRLRDTVSTVREKPYEISIPKVKEAASGNKSPIADLPCIETQYLDVGKLYARHSVYTVQASLFLWIQTCISVFDASSQIEL